MAEIYEPDEPEVPEGAAKRPVMPLLVALDLDDLSLAWIDIPIEQGPVVLLITHDMGVVASMANRVGVLYAGSVVENADVIPLFRRAQHPYTWSLLQSLPRMDDPGRRIQAVPGNPPDMVNMGDECPFLPRCFKAVNQCRQHPRPALSETEPGHLVACYNPVLPPGDE